MNAYLNLKGESWPADAIIAFTAGAVVTYGYAVVRVRNAGWARVRWVGSGFFEGLTYGTRILITDVDGIYYPDHPDVPEELAPGAAGDPRNIMERLSQRDQTQPARGRGIIRVPIANPSPPSNIPAHAQLLLHCCGFTVREGDVR
jgi:hypothetical protein